MPSSFLALDTVVAIAHRGGAGLRPENTIAAFDHAVSLGVDGIECDVHLSRDAEVVVIHDETLDRTTNATGLVSAHTADALARLDAAFRFGADAGHPFRGQEIGVPRLIDLLRRHRDTAFIVELKGQDPAIVERTVDVIRRAGAVDRVIVGGFNPAFLAAVRRAAPEIATSASTLEARAALVRSYVWMRPKGGRLYRLFQVPYRVNGRAVIGRGFVRAARRAEIPVQTWVIDELEDMRRLLGWGVTGIISDRPDRAVSIRANAGLHYPHSPGG